MPWTGDGHFGSSDIPADEYSADPYIGGRPGANDIPKHYDSSSIHTSTDLPTSSGIRKIPNLLNLYLVHLSLLSQK